MSPILLPFNYEQSHDPRVPKSKFLLQHSLNPPSSNVFQTLEARRGEFGRVDFEREAAEKKKKKKKNCGQRVEPMRTRRPLLDAAF